jgi:hypothetical protein
MKPTFLYFVRRRRFELLKAMPADLQSAPVDRLGTDAFFVLNKLLA